MVVLSDTPIPPYVPHVNVMVVKANVFSKGLNIGTITISFTVSAEIKKPSSNIDTHSYLFLADVLQQDDSGLPAAASWGHSGPDWEMDPEVVNDPRYANTLTGDLLAVPSISVVMDWDDLWAGGGQGIYIAGEADPRAASFERITADGTRTFQENGSIQIQGQSHQGQEEEDQRQKALQDKVQDQRQKALQD